MGEPVSYFYVSCSNCGREFHFANGYAHGFSHCDQHRGFTPSPWWEERW